MMSQSDERNSADTYKKIHLPILLLATAMAYGISESVGYGDSPYYADEILQGVLLEPGHLLWRPLGAVLNWMLQHMGYTGDLLWVLQGVSLVASVASVAAMFFFLLHWCSHRTALWGAALFGFSNGFWVYGISGCSYSLSVLFVILAFIFATPAKGMTTQTSRRVLFSGFCGGLAALSWLIQGLNLPFLLISNILFLGRLRDIGLKQTVTVGALFLTVYLGTLGLPLVGAYMGMSLLGTPLYVGTGLEGIGFLSWITSASHGIRTTFGLAQILRLVLGWAQSMVSLGDFGAQVRLWLLDGKGVMTLSLAIGFLKLSLFYLSVMGAIWLIWKRKSTVLLEEHKTILVIGVGALLANFMFSLNWKATDLERYLPSAPFLVLGFSIAFDNLRIDQGQRKPHGKLAWLITIGIIICLNWTGTVAPALSTDSYKQQWLTAIRQHMNHDDLLIILGAKKYAVGDPHNAKMPRMLNLSMQIILRSDPTEWKDLTLDWIRETRDHGGRVLLGDSILGLDSSPRDGWSFREYPVPSPKDLDDFFGPMKGDIFFSVAGERVWLAKPLP